VRVGVRGLRGQGRRQPHLEPKVLEPRVVAQSVEKPTRKAQELEGALLVGLFQPGHGLVLVPQAEVDDGEALGADVVLTGELLEPPQYLQRLAPSPGDSIRVPEPGVGLTP